MGVLAGDGRGVQINGFELAHRFSTTTVLNGVNRTESRIELRRRKVSPQTGRALEVLAHAIEYLSDELALNSLVAEAEGKRDIEVLRSQLAAIDALKRLNRELYLSCPIVPTFAQRCRALLQRRYA